MIWIFVKIAGAIAVVITMGFMAYHEVEKLFWYGLVARVM